MQVNGLEVAYHDPRGVSGMALSYATSPRGACHNQSDYFFVDWGHTEASLGIGYFPRHAQAEKAANVARHQDWRTVYNALRGERPFLMTNLKTAEGIDAVFAFIVERGLLGGARAL